MAWVWGRPALLGRNEHARRPLECRCCPVWLHAAMLGCACTDLCIVHPQVRVFCRLKPSPASAVAALGDGVSVGARTPEGKDATFTFDRVFAASTAQEAVFAEVSELVQSALDGYQVCCIRHGIQHTRAMCLIALAGQAMEIGIVRDAVSAFSRAGAECP